ncbi:MAG: hypothetical protein N3G19_00240 [Candidatus Pacearchaeota archaeon]|nr:hypothetical protein [Candidatus Pacearchaeota archaeon]
MIKIYEIELNKLQKIKNVLEAPDSAAGELDIELEKEQGKGIMEKARAWKVNEWKKNGYILRDAKALGIDKKVSFLYVSAPEDFFEKNEKAIVALGAKVLKGKDYDDVKAKIEESEAGAAGGLSLIFG